MTYRRLKTADDGPPIEIRIPQTEAEVKRERGRKVFWLVIVCAVGGFVWGQLSEGGKGVTQRVPANEAVVIAAQKEAAKEDPNAIYTTAMVALREKPSPASLTLLYVPAKTAVEPLEVAPRGTWLKITYNGKTGWIAGAQTTQQRGKK